MANKTIQIKTDALTSIISLDFRIIVDRKAERAVREAIDKMIDDISDRFEVLDKFEIGRTKEKAKEISEPTPIKQIIDKKKPKAKKLAPAPKKAETVEKAKA